MKFSAACISLFYQVTFLLCVVGGAVSFAAPHWNEGDGCMVPRDLPGICYGIAGSVAGLFVALCVISIAAAINAGILAARKAKATKR